MASALNVTRKRVSTENTAQSGVNAVEAIFLKMEWIFRRQLESDYGIDAQVEVVCEEGNPTGKLIGLQIKSGQSFFRKQGEDYTFRGKKQHLDYWDKHCLPVILVLHNPVDGMTLWQRIERHLVNEAAKGTWSIRVPKEQRLVAGSAVALLQSLPRSDPESDRRNRMALDVDLIRRVDDEGYAFVAIDEWVNKSLNFRAASISFEDYDAAPDHSIEFTMSAHNPSCVFDWIFPWLDFSYVDVSEEYSSEVLKHVFEVKLNRLGEAFLTLDNYYVNGAEPSQEIVMSEPTCEILDKDAFARH